jgi:hypothetical protein
VKNPESEALRHHHEEYYRAPIPLLSPVSSFL